MVKGFPQQPIKILEIKTDSWMKGLSIQAGYPVGGLFQTAVNFNPFETMGYMQPSLSPTQIDSTTITTTVNHLAGFNNGTDGYVFALGDRGGTGQKSFYRIQMSDLTVSDYSSNIDTNIGTGAVTHNGMAIFKSRVVYEQSGSIRSVKTDGTSDTNLLSSASTGGSSSRNDFVVGPDGNLYFTEAGNNAIGRIDTVNGTGTNTATAFTLETGLSGRGLTNDGRYLVIAEDDNDARTSTTQNNCKVAFWDCVRTTADVIYRIPDAYLIGCRFVNGVVYVMGASGLWACTFDTPPKLVLPLTSSQLPSGPNMMRTDKNILYWLSTAAGTRVYAYGALVGKPIFYSPYTSSSSNDIHTALLASGDKLFAATNKPGLFYHNTGSTRASATVETSVVHLDQPYQLAYAKVVLKNKMTSGQQIGLNLYNSEDGIIMDTNTKSYQTFGSKKDLLFNPNPVAGTPRTFEDIAALLSSSGGAVIKRLTVYGFPVDDNSQTL